MVYPDIASGSVRRMLKGQWQILKELRFANFGASTTILPLIPPEAAINETTHTTWPAASGSSQTATWSTAPSGLATPYTEDIITNMGVWATPGLYGPAGIPAIKLNGTSEKGDVPDADYWTRVAGAFSLIVCCVVPNLSTEVVIFSKYGAAGTREWILAVDANEKIKVYCVDDSAGILVYRLSDAGVTQNVPLHICVTKGTGNGATAMNDAVVYVNGSSVASTATNNASFVDMENLAAVVTFGAQANLAGGWPGTIFGGPFGPTFVQAQPTAAQVLRDYEMWREAMGLGR